MGNEMSVDSATHNHTDALAGGYGLEPERESFYEKEAVVKDAEGGDYEIHPMDEGELSRQLKASTEKVDIYDTGVSEQLKQLLATLHEEDPLVLAESSRTTGLSAAAQEFVPGKPFSATSVPEFVPGKTFVMERERSEAGSTGGAGLNTEAPAFVPSWQKSSATSTPSATASMTAAVTAATVAAASVSEKKVWWYRDPQGVVRGPFSTTEMRAWSEKGYFSGGLEVALSDRGPYLPLSSVYPSPERPFWKSMEPREFASRMRTHILSTRSAMTMSAATD